MNIRERLIFSHIMVCILPLLMSFFIIISSFVGLLLYAKSGNHVMAEDSFQFNMISRTVSGVLYHNIRHHGNYDDYGWVIEMADPLVTYVELREGENVLYHYGNDGYRAMLALPEIKPLAQDLLSSSDGTYSYIRPDRYVYMHREMIEGKNYDLYVLARHPKERTDKAIEEAFRGTGWFIIGALAFLVILTSFFLSKYIIGGILNPLKKLQKGAEEVQEGNPGIQISYDRKDEFTPTVEAFNLMSRKLKESLAEKEKEEENRKELIASISHDIRTPLTSIKAYVEGIIDGVADTEERRNRYLDVVLRKADVLERMLDQLFLLTRLDLGEKSLPLSRLDLGKMVEDFMEENRLSFENQGAKLVISCEKNIFIQGNPLLIGRIIENIVNNSIRYKNKEKVLISISVKGNRLTIQDDGPGVPEESLGRLIEAFYRTDKARSRTENGSGLGLSIVHRAVKLMKGTISFANGEEGLVVTMEFPKEEL